jgi:translation elongation factor EF-Tu-like GTPase
MSEKLYKVADDFEAEIRIFREDEGGRISAPFNGIRWDFAYDGDDITKSGIFMIWPDFFDAEGNSLSTYQSLAVDESLLARMTIVADEMRENIHRKRIHKGVRFYCHEGGKRVAEGIVTKITGLFNDR